MTLREREAQARLTDPLRIDAVRGRGGVVPRGGLCGMGGPGWGPEGWEAQNFALFPPTSVHRRAVQ